VKKMEKRTYQKTHNLRAESRSDGSKTLEGYFIVFDVETNIYFNYYEKVARESVVESVNNGEIVALFNHETDKVLGSQKAGTLKINIDDKGVYGVISLNEKDTEALNVYERVARGDIGGCSFGFTIDEELVDVDEQGNYHSTLKKIDVFEVSIVTFPAYKETDINARAKVEKTKIGVLKRQIKGRAEKCLQELKKI